MKTLSSVINAGMNTVLIGEINNSKGFKSGMWASNFEVFQKPFDEKVSVNVGDAEWKNTLYANEGLSRNINPCHMMRKVIYKIFLSKNSDNLGYCYSNPSEKETWCSYPDGTMNEVNDAYNKKGSCPRFIHMHVKDMHIVGASVKESVLPDQILEIGSGSRCHSAAAYLYAMLLNLVTTDMPKDNAKAKRLYEQFCELQKAVETNNLAGNEEMQKKLTIFENDFLLYMSDVEQLSKTFVLASSNDIKQEGIDNGECVFGGAVSNKKKKVKILAKSFETVADAEKSNKYRINHVFVEGEEKLVPNFYGDFDLTPEEEKMCKLIKGSEMMAAKRGGKRPFLNFMLQGEAGTGKSTAAAKIAQITGLPWRTFSCSAGTEEMDLLKKIIPNPSSEGRANIYVDSEIVETFRNGGIIEIQEVNLIQREGVINILNRGLDDFGLLRLAEGSYVHRHPDCVVIFTMNPDYEGTKPVNQSLLSRCQQIIEYNLPDKKKMVERVAKEHPLSLDLLNEMAESLFEVRRVIEDETVCDGICSYRELNSWAEEIDNLVNIWGEECNPYEAAMNTIVNHATADKDVRAEIANVIAKRFSAF